MVMQICREVFLTIILLTNERSNLSNETLMGLQKMKEFCGLLVELKTSIASLKTSSKQHGMPTSNTKKRKAQEEEGMGMKQEKEKRQIEEEKKQKEIIRMVEKNKDALDKKEEQLEQDEKKTDSELEVVRECNQKLGHSH